VAVVAGAVAAEGEPAIAVLDLEDDRDLVVVGTGDLALKWATVLFLMTGLGVRRVGWTTVFRSAEARS